MLCVYRKGAIHVLNSWVAFHPFVNWGSEALKHFSWQQLPRSQGCQADNGQIWNYVPAYLVSIVLGYLQPGQIVPHYPCPVMLYLWVQGAWCPTGTALTAAKAHHGCMVECLNISEQFFSADGLRQTSTTLQKYNRQRTLVISKWWHTMLSLPWWHGRYTVRYAVMAKYWYYTDGTELEQLRQHVGTSLNRWPTAMMTHCCCFLCQYYIQWPDPSTVKICFSDVEPKSALDPPDLDSHGRMQIRIQEAKNRRKYATQSAENFYYNFFSKFQIYFFKM